VLTERRGHILLVTLNRPDVRNAVNLAVSVGLGDALEGAEHDHGIGQSSSRARVTRRFAPMWT